MNKKLVKLLLIISIIFIGLFTNIKGVKASNSEFYNCDYKSALTYIDSSSRAANLNISFSFKTGYCNGWSLLYGARCFSEPAVDNGNISMFCLTKYDDGTWHPGFKLEKDIERGDDNTNIKQNTFTLKKEATGSTGDSKYVKLTSDGTYFKIAASNESEYKAYLEKQYSPLETDGTHYGLYDTMYIKGLESKLNFTSGNCNWDCTYTGIGAFVDGNDEYKKYVKNVGGIVLVKSGSTETYAHKNLDTFKEMMKVAKSNGASLTETQQQNALNGLGTIIDLDDVDDRIGSKAFYEATKDKWYTYMKDDLKNPKKAETTRKNYVSGWFTLVSRYVFEESENMSKFLEYFDYIYATGVVGNIDSKQYEHIRAIIEAMYNYKEADKTIETLESDKCLSLCSNCIQTNKNYNGSACTACQSGSNYKKCHTCTTKNCKNVPGTAQDSCLKGCMGDELYQTYTDSYEEAKKEAEEAKQDAADTAYEQAATLYALVKAEMPQLDIKFKKYEVKCEDISMFHNIYVIIIILAPAITITLGTVDYFRAVLAGDEKKMQEQKKKMPKRIIMLVCLILVPILIRIIIGLFTSLDNSLLDCVVNGI